VAGRLLILGAGGHARAVADLAVACGFTVAGFTDRTAGPGVIGGDADLAALSRAGRMAAGVVGVGNAALARRPELFALLRAAGVATPSLVHPRAVVSPSCRVGDGAVVFPAILGAHVTVGDNAVLYSGVVAEHECRIGDHAYLAPGVILSGAVTIERGAFVGAGAVLLPGVVVGPDAVVAAGAVVISDVRGGDTVVGVPARVRTEAP
jgi:UDP-perosamine 4-acetyltransferase